MNWALSQIFICDNFSIISRTKHIHRKNVAEIYLNGYFLCFDLDLRADLPQHCLKDCEFTKPFDKVEKILCSISQFCSPFTFKRVLGWSAKVCLNNRFLIVNVRDFFDSTEYFFWLFFHRFGLWSFSDLLFEKN